MKFRPGARRRMSLGIVVTVLGAAGCAPAPDQATRTVEYYRTHSEERNAMLRRCSDNPGELKYTPNCVNAREAGRVQDVGSLRDLEPLRLPPATPQ